MEGVNSLSLFQDTLVWSTVSWQLLLTFRFQMVGLILNSRIHPCFRTIVLILNQKDPYFLGPAKSSAGQRSFPVLWACQRAHSSDSQRDSWFSRVPLCLSTDTAQLEENVPICSGCLEGSDSQWISAGELGGHFCLQHWHGSGGVPASFFHLFQLFFSIFLKKTLNPKPQTPL